MVGPVTPTFFRSTAQLRRWLEKNYGTARELWVGFHRKASGRGGISYREALDEALCFGWIDGVRKRLDDESYVQRFTPRTARSYWSAVNTRRVLELKEAGRMHEAGLAAFERRDGAKTERYSFERQAAQLDAAAEKRFRASPKAWAYFQGQAPWYRRVAIHWVTSAKREETRQRRLATLISDSAAGRRIGLLAGSDRGQTGVRPGSDRGQTGVRPGSDRGQTGVRPGSDRGQTRVRPGSDQGQTPKMSKSPRRSV